MSNESVRRSYEKLSGEFINDFLNRASDEAASVFRSTPCYAELEEQQAIWGGILETLDETTMEEYKNSVNEAFVHYKQVLEDYSWTLGLTQTMERWLRSGIASDQQSGTLGAVIAAESRLQQVCKQFIERLSPECRGTGEKYLQLKKTSIDIGSAHCIRHGMEFTSRLLQRGNLTSGGTGSEGAEIL